MSKPQALSHFNKPNFTDKADDWDTIVQVNFYVYISQIIQIEEVGEVFIESKYSLKVFKIFIVNF